MSNEEINAHDDAAQGVVELANRLAEGDEEADLWDIADGLLSGAIHYWLYTRQPCADPRCTDCSSIGTGEERLAELLRLVESYARGSDYFHTPNDRNAGRA